MSISILKALRDEELVRLYNRALAVVFMARNEGFGLIALEAMACGTPVIGANEAGIKEIIVNDVTGYLIEREPALVAEKIRILQSNPRLRREMGRSAIEQVDQRWSWYRTVDQYEWFLWQLLSNQSE